MFNLTAPVLKRMWPNAPAAVVEGMVDAWPKVRTRFGFNTQLRCAHFWTQASWECGNGCELRENGRYSADAIMRTFGVGSGSSAKVTREDANKLAVLARADGGRALFNRVYGVGNPKKVKEFDNTGPDDGWNYRGFGVLNSTGKDAARRIGGAIGADLLGNPDLCNDPGIALLAGAYEYAVMLRCLPFADADNIDAESRRINGGDNGLAGRRALLPRWKQIVADNWSDGPLTAALPPLKPSRDPDAAAPAADSPADFIAAADPFDPANMTEDEIKAVKTRLVAMGYVEVGAIDGDWGSRTTAAVAALQHDAGLQVTGRYDAGTRDVVARGYQRPIADARANATAADLKAAGSTTVQAADQGITVGQIVAGAGAAGTAVTAAQGSGVMDQINQASQTAQQISSLQYTFQSLAPIWKWAAANWWVWIVLAGVGLFLIWQNRKIIAARLADHQSGANTGR